MLKQEIKQIIEQALGQKIELEHPTNPEFGDFSTNAALKLKIDPKDIIKKLKNEPAFEKIETAGPGFINFFLSKERLFEELNEILIRGNDYGQLDLGQGKKVQVEFISANPTGPLTVANSRGGPFGEALANVLKKAGYQVEKEYYVNDYGQQILVLGHSVLKDAEAKYKGKYIDELHQQIKEQEPFKAGQAAAKKIIESIKKTVKRLGIDFDNWVFESELHQAGQVDNVLKFLKEKDLMYQKDGAWWFKSTNFGDQRDRVLVKADGVKTYLAGDIAYHWNKFSQRGFDKVIDVWGADHHGDMAGLLAGVEAIGHQGKLEIILHQFITILEKGEKKRMSKRAGLYVLMDELLDQVSPDAIKFFFLQKSVDTHLNFDLALAKEQSKKNPVYYIQYAHARIQSILTKSKIQNPNYSKSNPKSKIQNYKLLIQPTELALIRHLIRFPEIIEDTARDYQVQRLPQYALELADSFHRFYESCRVISEEEELTQARISLIKAAQIVLKNVLGLMGISAPERM